MTIGSRPCCLSRVALRIILGGNIRLAEIKQCKHASISRMRYSLKRDHREQRSQLVEIPMQENLVSVGG